MMTDVQTKIILEAIADVKKSSNIRHQTMLSNVMAMMPDEHKKKHEQIDKFLDTIELGEHVDDHAFTSGARILWSDIKRGLATSFGKFLAAAIILGLAMLLREHVTW